MALFDRETDPQKERDGVALDFGEYRVTLRRQGGANDRYQAELEKESKPLRAAAAAGVLPQAKADEATYKAFARACVVKWETLASTLPADIAAGLIRNNLVASDGFVAGIDMRGELVPCNEANLVAVFTALPGVFLDLREAARGEQLFRLKQREDDAGN
jgi:hypothetical protein